MITSQKNIEHRYKYLIIDIEEILNLLYPLNKVNIITKLKLPEDVVPLTAHYDERMLSFKVLLYSETYPIVPSGAEVPCIWDKECIVVEKYKLIQDDNNE